MCITVTMTTKQFSTRVSNLRIAIDVLKIKDFVKIDSNLTRIDQLCQNWSQLIKIGVNLAKIEQTF